MKVKEAYTLYKLIRANDNLKDERHPMFEKNRFMKVLMWFMLLYYAALLLLLGVTLPAGLSGTYCDVAGFHVLDGVFPYILIADFYLRFLLQETPAQQAKPYTLLPIHRSFLMHMYLTRSMLSWGNLFWGFMLVPFGMIAVWPLLGFGAFLSWIIGWWLLFIVNSLAYLFSRALCIKRFAWVLLPLAIHGALLAIMLVPDRNPLDMPCTRFLYAFALCDLWPYLALALVIAFFYFINYRLQMSMVHDEVAKKEEVTVKATTQMNYLNRFGAMGEYLKMEMKLRLRNKQVRTSMLVGLGLIIFFTLMQYFSDVYDNTFMKSFICLYDYVVLGMMTLITIMGYEGNYIDGLMSRRESIYDLLRAKYYFNMLQLILPFLLLIPLMIIGKQSVWMNLGYMFLTAGVIYPLLFQLAVYNRDTIPLNQKLIGKQGNMMQQIISVVLLFLPIAVERLAVLALGDVWGYVLLIAIGVAGIALHKRWLMNIYTRFMARRYTNMEGFRASRNS